MSKYSLQCKINDARNRQNEIDAEIQNLQNKIEIYISDRYTLENETERQYDYIIKKRTKINLIRDCAAGVANSSMIQRFDEMHNDTAWQKVRTEIDEIIGIINYNIRVANERIQDLRDEYGRLSGSIEWWKREIADIERKEAEERAKLEAERLRAQSLV